MRARTLAAQSMLESDMLDGFVLGDQQILGPRLIEAAYKWIDDCTQERAGA